MYDLFMKDKNIIFACFFGGFLKKEKNPLSDIDIAVYVKDVKKMDFIDLYCRISDVLLTDEVDLVILNSSPISLSGRIVQNRELIVDKNPFLRHQYESVTLRKFFDFSFKEKDILRRRYGIG